MSVVHSSDAVVRVPPLAPVAIPLRVVVVVKTRRAAGAAGRGGGGGVGLGELVVRLTGAFVTGRELGRRVAALSEHLETKSAVSSGVLVVIPEAVHTIRKRDCQYERK
jgi:hypothetical protein